jgi:cytochrome P450
MLAQTAFFATRPLQFLNACRRRYGDVFELRIAPFGRLIYLADPEACKQVFTGDPAVFRAGQANQFMEITLGRRSLLLLDEDEHLRTRKLMLPPFHGDAVRRYAEQMAGIAVQEVERWPAGRPFGVRPSMQRITLEVILRTVFGIDDAERLARLRELIPAVIAPNFLIFGFAQVDLGAHSPYGRYLRVRDRLDALLFDEIARRRRDPGLADRVDVLSLLIASRLPDGGGLSDPELRDELMTLLLAGHETTATALAWACERLARHPAAQARAREDDEYLDAAVKETLRARPVVIDVARALARPAIVAGYEIEPPAMVVPAIAVVQSAAENWPDPEAFRPERFLDETPPAYSWIPFGGGVRRCIGAAFAQQEMKAVLRVVLERAELAPPPGAADEAQRLRHVTLVPARGGEVVVTRREAASPRPAPEAAEPAARA